MDITDRLIEMVGVMKGRRRSLQEQVCIKRDNIFYLYTFSDHYNTPDYPSLTWDTLKRRRRQNSKVNLLLKKPYNDLKNCEFVGSDKYKSSPDLFGGNNSIEEGKNYSKTRRSPQILKHTSKSVYSIL